MLLQSTVYAPFHDLVAPILLKLAKSTEKEQHLLLVKQLRNVRWHDDKTRSSVDRSACVLQLQLLLAKRDRLKLDLPVPLPPHGDVADFASVRILVDPTKHRLPPILLRAAETEREHRLVEKTLSEHVVKGRDDVVDRDGVIAHTEDTVELAESKGESWLLSGLGKVLLLDGQVTDGDGVLGDEAFERA